MNVRDWFDNLSERERNLVYAAGALVGVALVYLVLVLPFQTSGKRMAARVAQKTADLAWMQASAPQAMAAAGAAQAAGGGDSLVVLVDRTAREAGLGNSLRDQSPDGSNGLRLRIEGASFGIDGLRAWILGPKRPAFVRQFCKKLLGYALGRSVFLSDTPLLPMRCMSRPPP